MDKLSSHPVVRGNGKDGRCITAKRSHRMRDELEVITPRAGRNSSAACAN
ncbi:MAG: hypothetical protein ACTSU4_11280 [Promethearchaeota archaeon]